MKQLDRKNAEDYWKTHSKVWADLDRKRDPEGLANVCYNGAPLWYNKFFAHFQKVNYRRLLKLVPGKDLATLDLGCGAGRWCRILKRRGWDVTGIDLQEETIGINKKVMPGISFDVMNIADMKFKDGSFGFISSVAVIQHIPLADQLRVLDEIARVLKRGGYFLLIENTKDKEAVHVFPRKYREWMLLMKDRGFIAVKHHGEQYAPLSRLMDSVIKLTFRLIGKKLRKEANSGEEHAVIMASKGFKEKAYYALKFPIIMFSYPVEHICDLLLPGRFATYGAYLFKKVR